MSLPNNFNHQIYLSDLLVLFLVTKFLPINFNSTFQWLKTLPLHFYSRINGT
jgi:hypothetical protein